MKKKVVCSSRISLQQPNWRLASSANSIARNWQLQLESNRSREVHTKCQLPPSFL